MSLRARVGPISPPPARPQVVSFLQQYVPPSLVDALIPALIPALVPVLRHPLLPPPPADGIVELGGGAVALAATAAVAMGLREEGQQEWELPSYHRSGPAPRLPLVISMPSGGHNMEWIRRMAGAPGGADRVDDEAMTDAAAA